MKLISIFITAVFVFTASIVFAEEGFTWKCKSWEKVPVTAVKADKKPAKKIVPIKQKIKDIEPEKVLCPKELKNTILFQPMLMYAYSRQFKDPVFVPGLSVTYLRDVLPNFVVGAGVSYAHAFYTKSFNMVGINLSLGYKF
ncbi:MAG TPA: hypothetical protein P5136_06365 [Methanofastidiosum sp.]|nr:hypothetical protein [Methanofastidiosum sp.]